MASYLDVIICSTTYIWTHLDQIEETIFSTMQFVAYGAILGTYVSLVWKKQNISNYFRTMENFVYESEKFLKSHYPLHS